MTDTHTQDDVSFVVTPGGILQGRIRVTGDKSISHRAIMLGAIAEGTTHITGFLEGEDCLATIQAFRSMGVHIEGPEYGVVKVHGVGLRGLKCPSHELDVGNSGTSMRLLLGLLAGHSLSATLIGDHSLMRRPMRRVTDPLQKMGANIQTSVTGTPPLHVGTAHPLHGIEYAMPIASAQVKSCILLAGLYAKGTTCVTEPAPTRDHTERMLEGFGYPLKRSGSQVCIEGGHCLTATHIDVPTDISSAAFFMVGASIAKGSDLLLEHVGINPTRTGIIDILRLMGANIAVENPRQAGGEPVADIRIRSADLHGIEIPDALVPLAIDEFPAIFIAAACAQGRTVLTGAKELRVKESDRIQVMSDGLQACGISALPTDDGIIIEGGQIGAGHIQSHGDHRIAMAFAMAGLGATGVVQIHDCANVNTSFPGFAKLAKQTGLAIAVKDVH